MMFSLMTVQYRLLKSLVRTQEFQVHFIMMSSLYTMKLRFVCAMFSLSSYTKREHEAIITCCELMIVVHIHCYISWIYYSILLL